MADNRDDEDFEPEREEPVVPKVELPEQKDLESAPDLAANYGDMIVKMLGAITEDLTLADIQKIQKTYLKQIGNAKKTAEEQKADMTLHSDVMGTNEKINPINFGMQYLYDAENGVSRSRQECEEAIERLTRNVREVDFQPFLDLASSFHGKDERMEKLCVGLAFNTIHSNRVIQKLEKDNTSQMLSNAQVIEGFSLTNAKKFESVIELPSRRTFLMSQLITAEQASKFTSLEHAKELYRVTFEKLASMDKYFAVYTAYAFSNSGYHPFGGSFFTQTAKFVCDGFGEEFTEDLEASCTCAARKVLNNLIERIRKELKKQNYDTATILRQLNHIAQKADDIDRSLLDSTGPPI